LGQRQASAGSEQNETVALPTVVVDKGPFVIVPDFSGMTARSVVQECQKRHLDLRLSGSGLAVGQSVPANVQVPLGTRLVVSLSR
jgi:hypothetical protein